jgi:hypothetical protein
MTNNSYDEKGEIIANILSLQSYYLLTSYKSLTINGIAIILHLCYNSLEKYLVWCYS